MVRGEAAFTVGRFRPNGNHPAPDPLEACRQSQVNPPTTGIRVGMMDMVEQRIDPDSYHNRQGDLRGWLR